MSKKLNMKGKYEIATLRNKHKTVKMYFDNLIVAEELANDIASLFGLILDREVRNINDNYFVLVINKFNILLKNTSKTPEKSVLLNDNNSSIWFSNFIKQEDEE